MAGDDFSGVIVVFDKPSYVAGELVTLTVLGQNRHTDDGVTTQETVTVSVTVESAGGVTATLAPTAFPITRTTPGVVTAEDVTIVAVTDSSNRTWMMSGRSATTIA